jgi:dihydrofolate reductase
MNKRKIILNLAMSLDWFIANEDGSYDWIIGDWDSSQNTEKQFNFNDFLKSIDTVVMWRKAYNDCERETLTMLADKTIYVATHSEIIDKSDNIISINWNISQQIQRLQKSDGKDIYLWWGDYLADDFIKSDIIDEYIIGIIPTILWKWKPLFLENNPTIKLNLTETTVTDWIVILKYKKKK